jgi:fucose 4-O-acetylase-like acetyltransferase
MLFIPFYILKAKLGIELPYYVLNVSAGMAFYTLGYLFRNFQIRGLLLALVLSFYGVIIYIRPIDVPMWKITAAHSLSDVLLWLPVALTGIIAINGFAKLCFNKDNFFSWLGKYSMSFYCIHWIILQFVNLFWLGKERHIGFLCTVLVSNIVLLPIITVAIKRSRFKDIV